MCVLLFFFFFLLFLFVCFFVAVVVASEKITLGISCKSSAWQMIHISCQVLVSLKNNLIKKQNVICYYICILLSALRFITA